MVTFVIFNNSDIVDDTNNRFEYIQSNPVNLKQTLTIGVQYWHKDSEQIVIVLQSISGDEISGDELNNMEEKDEGKGNE